MLATAQATAETNVHLTPSTQKVRVKMERRDSSTSESSLENLDLGQTPKKRSAHAATSTPHVEAFNHNNKDGHESKDSQEAGDTIRSLDSDEINDYDEELTEEQRQHITRNADNVVTTTPRSQRHHKRRGNRPEKHTLVQLEYNADNPNSLRKKFRFNRSASENGNTINALTSNESGFVDASSQYLNASATQNSGSSGSSSPQDADGGNSSSPEFAGANSADREREDMKYLCPICEVVSATPHEFTNHIRCHNYASGDTENFTCRICSKVLSSASSLDRHVLVHTGERPFNCKYCHLTFTTNGNMHRHMRTHKQHQHNHQRRNSNGTKNNNNNHNQQNNNHTTSNNLAITKTTNSEATLQTPVAGVAAATALYVSNVANQDAKLANSNGYHHMNGGVESCDSDDVEGEKPYNDRRMQRSVADDAEDADICSTDSCSANSHNNNNNNNIKNNNVKSTTRKRTRDHCLEINEDADDALMLKRRIKTINNNTIVDGKENGQVEIMEDELNGDSGSANILEPLPCPVCESVNFSNLLSLSEHMDVEHAEIPAKCRRCEVVFRTHRQLNVHPCSGVSQLSIGDFAREKFPMMFREESNKDNLTETEALQQKIRSYFLERAQSKPILLETLNASTENLKELQKEEHKNERDLQQKREEFLREMFLKSQRENTPTSTTHNNDEQNITSETPSAPLKFESMEQESSHALSISQQSHDSKDFADIQSILNMTSSSSTSNFLKNFEQSVNTPSSNYSLDKDEEEAQDAFTAEFRKMKLRGEFPCKLCTAIYPNLRALKGHNRIHLSSIGPTGPFRCNMCPYSICDKSALIRHMRTHNGDRPYECAVCNYAFTTKANCERHLRNRHGKTTREEVKRAIIYHPSEDSSCDDPVKKLHMFSSPDFDDDLMDLPYTQQPPPKDRSTPVSHLKEMLTAGYSNEGPSGKTVKIQVKSMEKLFDKGSPYVEPAIPMNAHLASEENMATAPIDLSMDVLDLSKKSTVSMEKPVEKYDSVASSLPANTSITTDSSEPSVTTTGGDEKMDLLLAQQQLLMNEAFPKFVDPAQYLQQLYRQLMFQPLNPFFLQNPLFAGNLPDLHKLTPFMNRMFGVPDAVNTLTPPPLSIPAPQIDVNKPQQLAQSPSHSTVSTLMPQQLSPLMIDKSSSNIPNYSVQLPPSKALTTQVTGLNQMSRNVHMSPATVLPGGPVKMVIKNGVLMPKQKQRRYRTERPFACEHCSARFTLRSNMERHVKQQHPQYYAQRQRSGHHMMRGRGTTNSSVQNINHLQSAVAQQSPTGNNSTISDQVKYAILAQQLKAARRDSSDLLQQALAHGSGSILAPGQMLFGSNPALATMPNGSFAFNQMNSASMSGVNGSMEDDEPKLIIDEDENEEDDGEEDGEEMLEDEDIMELEVDNIEEEKSEKQPPENISQSDIPEITENCTPVVKKDVLSSPNAAAKKVAENILEQAIKVGQNQTVMKPEPLLPPPATVPLLHAPPLPPPSSLKSMIAHAESVGKFLKEVASSPFKDESQDLVPVSKLVDNATNNAVSFSNIFRPSDVANHMEQSDEEGLVASGSASESNNSGTEDVVAPIEPKKKSAYSLAPNRVSCPYCQRMFPWSSSLRRHILTHTGQKPFKCSHCPLLFTTKSNCDRHLLRKHGNVESAVSVYVPTEDVSEPIPVPKSVEEIEQQQRKREEEERRRKHEEAANKEREQRELMERQRQLQKHQSQQQQQQKHQQQVVLLQEQEQQQLLLKQLATTVANNSNNTKIEPNVALTSTELPFKCHLCESSFGDRFQCLEHIKSFHVQEFNLLLAKGAVDTEVDSNQATVEEEERRAVEESVRNGTNGKYPDYSNRKVICAFCMRRFWSTEDLRRHMRTHSGERPFQCEICLRKFTLKHSMLRHMKKHAGRSYNGNNTNGDLTSGMNSGSDFSDDEQTTPTTNAPTMTNNNTTSSLSRCKMQELFHKANEWRNSRLNTTMGEQKENIAEESNNQPNDLIGNLLGISDQGILNKLLSSPDEAAKLLGVEK